MTTRSEQGKVNNNDSFALGNIHHLDNNRIMSYLPSSVNYLYADLKLILDKANNFKKLKKLFKKRLEYDLNLNSPKSYNEKIIWKKLYDRNPLLVKTADKYTVRDYVKEVLGEDDGKKFLIPLYHATSNPDEIPFDALPEKFVIKPNHGSGMHMIVKNKSKVSRELILEKCRQWLKFNYGIYHYEWAYRDIKRKIVIEKLLQSQTGELPQDFKLYCFNGKCKFIRVTTNRFDQDFNTGFFDLDWNLMDVSVPGYGEGKHHFEKPKNLVQMITLAEKLSVPFDFVRVDLFDLDNKIYFGELTHYEGSGLAKLEPQSVDFELGKLWSIKPEYWNKNF